MECGSSLPRPTAARGGEPPHSTSAWIEPARWGEGFLKSGTRGSRRSYNEFAESGRTPLRQSLGIVLNPTPFSDRNIHRSEAQTTGPAALAFWLPEPPDVPTSKVPLDLGAGRRRPVDNSWKGRASIGIGPRPGAAGGRFVRRGRQLRPASPPSYPQLGEPVEARLYSTKFFGILGLVGRRRSCPQRPSRLIIITAIEFFILFLKKPGTRSIWLPAQGLLRRFARSGRTRETKRPPAGIPPGVEA